MNFLNRFKYARDSYFVTGLIVLIVLMLNFVASRHFIRIDLTSNQIYTLSDSSKDLIGSLDDIVTVKVFFSDQLPRELFLVRQYVGDILDELTAYSKGYLEVDYLNPADPDVAHLVDDFGIPQIRMNIVEKDKVELKNGYLGISVVYGDKTEILPVVRELLSVEYDLVSAIKKVTSESRKQVGFVTGQGEPSIADQIGLDTAGDSYSFARQAMERNYDVLSVNLNDATALSEVDTLLIAGPRTAFSDDQLFAVDQFLVSGGKVVMMLDSAVISEGLIAEPLQLNLGEFLAQKGLGLGSELVLDQSNERASFSEGFVNFALDYPFWIKAVKQYFDPSNPVVTQLDSIVLPWTSPLTLLERKGVVSTALVRTTPEAWIQESNSNLDPSLIQSVTEKEQFVLAALQEGQFTSYFPDRESKLEAKPGHLFVIGNSRFVLNRFVDQFPQNLNFFMNVIDYLTLDDSLIGVRSKVVSDLPIDDLSLRERQFVRFVGVVLMPLLVVVLGVTRYFVLKKKKFKF